MRYHSGGKGSKEHMFTHRYSLIQSHFLSVTSESNGAFGHLPGFQERGKFPGEGERPAKQIGKDKEGERGGGKGKVSSLF